MYCRNALVFLWQAESKAAMKEAKNAGVHGHYGPAGSSHHPGSPPGAAPTRGRGAEIGFKYGDDAGGRGSEKGSGGSRDKRAKDEQDEDEAQLDPEILALIEKEIGGGGDGGEVWESR